jgi:pre-mRNA-splicing factor CWC22
MIAHLINQQIVHELLALQLLALFLETPTEDSVELACDFAI